MKKKRLIRILDRYLFSEAFSLYLIGFFGFLAFLIINQLFLEGDRLLNPNFPTREILKLIFLNVPYFITLTIPVAVLFATLMSMGRLGKDNEIDAFFTNGIHLSRLFVPYLILALGNVIFNFYVDDKLVPIANAKSEEIYEKYPYLREEQVVEADPVIVKLPGGAFLASTSVDKKSGTVFYALHDTLTADLEEISAVEKKVGAGSTKQQLKQEPMSPRERGQSATPNSQAKNSPTSLKEEKTLPRGEGAFLDRAREEISHLELAQQVKGKPTHEDELAKNLPQTKLAYPNLRMITLAVNGKVDGLSLDTTRPYIYRVGEDGLVAKREEEPYLQLFLGLPLKDLYSTIRTPEQLSREELQRQTEVKRKIGLNPAKDATDFFLKFSTPFASLILALVGVPLSLRAPRDERLLGLIIVYLLCTGYYVVYFVCKLMGYNEILPPFLAAWMQNIVFLFIAGIIFIFARK